jgi:hypothetical protein
MTSMQKQIFVALAVLLALTRLLAVSQSLFDWDEALFARAVQEYNVSTHHPHPPGYPLFVAAAKVLNAAGLEAFRALQAVVVASAMLLFPAVFLLARGIGFGFAAAASGAAIYCVLPNVWIYSGTAFSDIPALVLTFCACWALLRGRTSRRHYIAGAVLLGVAAGIRLPSLMIAVVPAFLGTIAQLRARNFGAVVTAALLGGTIVSASYYAAAAATGSWESYVEAVQAQRDYVRRVDSWRNPGREPLHEVAEDFFLRPIQRGALMFGLLGLGAVSVFSCTRTRRHAPLLTIAAFTPIAVTSWLNLDVQAAGRYSMCYLVAYALLASDGLCVLSRARAPIQAALTAAVAVALAAWTWPALHLQRTSDSPPVAALRWVNANAPAGAPVYVHAWIRPQADLLLPERHTLFEPEQNISAIPAGAWIVDLKHVDGAMNFSWPTTNPLWRILRRRNFEVSVFQVPADGSF